MKNIFSFKSLSSVLYFMAGLALVGGIWELISHITKHEIPTPHATWIVFKEVMQNPFQNDPDANPIDTARNSQHRTKSRVFLPNRK